MKTIKPVVASIAILAALVSLGCASAYHDNPCGCVSYEYCPRSPLPYTPYAGCPTPVAIEFATAHAATPDDQPTYAQNPAPGLTSRRPVNQPNPRELTLTRFGPEETIR